MQQPKSFVIKANETFKAKGWDKASLKYNGASISMNYDGSGSNSSAYAKDGKWEHTTDTAVQYVENTTLAMGFKGYITSTVYDTLSDADKEMWVFDFEYKGTSYYYANFKEPVDGWNTPSKENNTVLYIVVGAVAVVAILAIVFFFIKKK